MKLDRFDIELDNSENAYFAGQEITGKIIIDAPEPKKVNEILLELKGRCRTSWTKHSGKSRKHCNNSEPYFLEQFNTGYTAKYADADCKDRVLPAGHHEIPFSYTLPKSLPSSFEGEYGFVRYTCRAICERPWDFDIVSRTPFTVVGIEDINTETSLCEPATVSDSNQTMTAMCWKSAGNVNAELSLGKTGYTPGECIHVTIKITNNSSKTRKVILKMTQHVTYKAKTFAGTEQSKTMKKVVLKKEVGDIAAHACDWHPSSSQSLRIPSLPPRLGRCKSIVVTYSVDLDVELAVSLSIPFTIGTIPLLSELLAHTKGSARNGGSRSGAGTEEKEEAVVQVTITDEDGQTHTDDALSNETDALMSARKRVRMPSSILSELYPSVPSPYYRESHFGKSDINDDKENVQFGANTYAPKYPFYCD